MANLAARETFFNDLFDFRRDLNGIFSRLVTGAPLVGERALKMIAAVPPIEAWVDQNEKKYHLSFALAGVDPKDIQLSLQGNNLTVSGEQKASELKGASREMVETMSERQLREFASTKRRGLPRKRSR